MRIIFDGDELIALIREGLKVKGHDVAENDLIQITDECDIDDVFYTSLVITKSKEGDKQC